MDWVVKVDGSPRHRCDLRWANRLMREVHCLPQTSQVYIIVPLAATGSFLVFRLATHTHLYCIWQGGWTPPRKFLTPPCCYKKRKGGRLSTSTVVDFNSQNFDPHLMKFDKYSPAHTHTHTHPFNGSLSGTTRVGRYQKGKTNLDFTEARDNEWQWHQLGQWPKKKPQNLLRQMTATTKWCLNIGVCKINSKLAATWLLRFLGKVYVHNSPPLSSHISSVLGSWKV